MEPPILFCQPTSVSGDTAILDKAETHHGTRVLRLRQGNLVTVIDGVGNAYRGELLATNKKGQAEVRIISTVRNFGETETIVSLAAGLSTGYKFDAIVEKGTELGIKRFVPLITEKSKVKLDEPSRLKSRQTRLQKVALAAIKQCRRSYCPEISLPTPFKQFLTQLDEHSMNLIFHPDERSNSLTGLVLRPAPKRVCLIIGPESGFNDEELSAAVERGAVAVSMGRRILRTETAGPAAAAVLMHLLGEFS